jgi:polyvinyl alcohol dehydrogenase (cytochrome)
MGLRRTASQSNLLNRLRGTLRLLTWFPLTVTMVTLSVGGSSAQAQDWPMFGQNIANSGSTLDLTLLPITVPRLAPKWTFTTGGDVSARAAVVNGVAYFPDWGGNLTAVNANNGKAVWSHQLSDYGLPASTHSRTSPAVVNGVLYTGTQEGGWLLAINAQTGALIWKMQPEPTGPFPVITASPTVIAGIVYTGVASTEEDVAVSPTYPCCTARGSVVAVNALNGKIIWKTYTIPTGYSGGSVWGSNPVVDLLRGTVFVGTGNNYSVPTTAAYQTCIANGGTEASCISPDDHIDSILAFDMLTGRIKWAQRMVDWNQAGITNGFDSWNVGCFFASPNCPVPTGPDYDFGSAPNEVTFLTSHGLKQIIGAGQKSGIYYAFDPDTGAEVWQTQVGPGSSLGGMEWGSSTDGIRIYVAISNYYGIPSSAGSAGSWAALDPNTGAILWQVADPNGAIDIGPISAANGVVYAASMAGAATAPTMLALDARNGSTLWSYAAGSSVNAGAAISNGTVYWGSGYAHLGIPGFTGNNKFYAFSINGR